MDEPEIVAADAVIAGGGPAGLATAIALADWLEAAGETRRIVLIDKGKEIGSHILSGAVVRPEVFQELLGEEAFAGIPFDAPVDSEQVMWLRESGSTVVPIHPPYMSNRGNRVASLGEICRYLARVAEAKGVEIYPGFSVEDVVYDGGKISGIVTGETGVDRHGNHQKNYQPPTQVNAAITILAEGSRGSVTRRVIERHGLTGNHPQVYSLGVKELWFVPDSPLKPGTVLHTFGYPLKSGAEFGGGFVYGLSGNRVAVGLVVGLDYADPSWDIHAAMQIWKAHPDIRKYLQGGTMLEAGAKTLPEGGWHALPRYYDDHLLLVGDGAGFLSIPQLKGIHLAVRSGMLAGQTAAEALLRGDTGKRALSRYADRVNGSEIRSELYPVRNVRAVLGEGIIRGGLKMGIQMITGGGCLLVPKVIADRDTTQKVSEYDGRTFSERFSDAKLRDSNIIFDKVTTVFRSGTSHDEQQPVHVRINDPEEFVRSNIGEYGLAEAAMCPAEVYEYYEDANGEGGVRFHPENCLHCKTCDIKSPNGGITWHVPYGGDGPDYRTM